ncbi:MAG TPA: peptide MFS transporter [Burkholderiaceae bacterium]|nr:peptide MFS transporter [Burkholderiaceae bacterium]
MNTLAGNLPFDAAGATRGQPRGLRVIFLTEMWERFSYYGMRALLVLYLVHALHYDSLDAQAMYGVYTGLVYLTPMVGGWIADRWLGNRLAAVIGGTVMMLGHFAMAVPSLLYVALGLLIIGNGLFKPNTSSMVGELYDSVEDTRLDGGYTIFYMGINLGAFLAPLICGTLGEKVGWHYGFASAGVGMAIGLFTLIFFQRSIGRAGLRAGQSPIAWKDVPIVAIFVVASIALVYGTLAVWPLLAGLSWPVRALVVLLVVVGALFGASRLGKPARDVAPLTTVEWKRVGALCVVALFSIVFWMGFEQAGGSMNLFADTKTDRVYFGWEMPATWFQTINSLLILLLAPVFAALWTALNRSRFKLPDTAKQGLGLMVLGLGFMVMYGAQTRADLLGTVGPQWLIVTYLLHTMGELMLSPVGLALTSRSAPSQLTSMMMGVWFFSSAAGNYLAGSLGKIMQGTGIAPYLFLTYLPIAAGVVLLALTPILHRMLVKRDISTTA